MRYRSLFFFTGKAIKERLQRVFLMILSISLSVGLFVSMIILSKGMRERLSGELSAYGANALMTSSEYINQEIIDRLLNRAQIRDGIEEVLPELYGSFCFKGIRINGIGMPFENMKTQRITGRAERGYILAGRRLAEAGGLREGEEISLSIPCGGPERRFKISGIFERVGPEDDAIVMELKEMQNLLGLQNRLSVVMLRIRPEVFDSTMNILRKEFPGLEVKAIRQIAHSEESLLRKIEFLLIIVSIVVVTASFITVAGIMAATIFERLTDIGLMKATGATNRQIQAFFILEAVIAGIAGSLGGLLLGTGAAELIALSAFHRVIAFPLLSIPLAFTGGLIISTISALAPVRKVTACRASIILRGEI